jgi:hypothetical protein
MQFTALSTSEQKCTPALALIGQIDEARAAVKAELARDPSFTIHRFRAGVRRECERGKRTVIRVAFAMSAICQLDSQQLKSDWALTCARHGWTASARGRK